MEANNKSLPPECVNTYFTTPLDSFAPHLTPCGTGLPSSDHLPRFHHPSYIFHMEHVTLSILAGPSNRDVPLTLLQREGGIDFSVLFFHVLCTPPPPSYGYVFNFFIHMRQHVSLLTTLIFPSNLLCESMI